MDTEGLVTHMKPPGPRLVRKEGKSMDENTVMLPKYKCHKEVGALKIKDLIWNVEGTLTIVPEEAGFAPIVVAAKYVHTHDALRPTVGWYFVEYEDGYQSFSPAEAFEKGYTRIPG